MTVEEMSLKNPSLNESSAPSMQDKTLEVGMLLAMLKQSVSASAYKTSWPTSYSALKISTTRPSSRPAKSEIRVESKSPKMSETLFSKLTINTGPPKQSQKPESPTSVSDIDTLTIVNQPWMATTTCKKTCGVPELATVTENRLLMAPRIPETPHGLMTPHVSEARIPVMPHVPETSRIPIMTPPIPDVPPIPETRRVPAQLAHKNLGKIVCKKCDRLLDRARRCCGTYSVALCIRVEHIPERYRPRVTCSGKIRAHFPSFAKATRYRLFLSNQMRKKRKLRFLVETEDSGEDTTRKRQRSDSVQKIATTKSMKTNMHMTGFNTPNLMSTFSNTYSFSPTIPWQFNQPSTFGYGLTHHGLTPPIGTISRDKLFITPPD